jgi:hypothetical protein
MEWLHFCDFHIGEARGPQAEVLKSLLEKVQSVCGPIVDREDNMGWSGWE